MYLFKIFKVIMDFVKYFPKESRECDGGVFFVLQLATAFLGLLLVWLLPFLF